MSTTETPKETPKAVATEFEGVTPILRVGNLPASIEYYVGVLGFKADWRYEGIIASVSRDRCHIFLCEGDQGNPGSWVWIGVGDAEALFEEYKSREQRSGIRPATSLGRTRCKSRISTGTCCAWAPSRSRAGRPVNGAICTATCGRGRRRAGRGGWVKSGPPATSKSG